MCLCTSILRSAEVGFMQMLVQQDESIEEQCLLHMLIHPKEAISVGWIPVTHPGMGQVQCMCCSMLVKALGI